MGRRVGRGTRVLILCALVVGCSADPNRLTLSRQDEANNWASDVSRRQAVETYMNTICSPNGWWAAMDADWKAQQTSRWNMLWRFDSYSIDWTTAINALLAGALKVAPLFANNVPPRAALGVPPC
jgi:hypothetical protein